MPLDRERKAEYTVSVLAMDCDPITINRKTSRSNLIIHIADVNDNQPTFEQSPPTPSIAEIINIGESILVVTATDLDEGLQCLIPQMLPVYL